MTLRLQVRQPRCIRCHVPVDSLLAADIGGHRWKASNRVRYYHLHRVFFRSMRRQCSIVMPTQIRLGRGVRVSTVESNEHL
jgi:hypothetical protein